MNKESRIMYNKGMKMIVTHNSPDLDAVSSSWIIKRFLPGWEDAEVITVPAGGRINTQHATEDVIEHLDGKEVIHVDTGMGPLDHHQTQDENTCAAKRALDYVLDKSDELQKNAHKVEALKRVVEYVVDDDHFQEVYYPDPTADVYEFSLVSFLSGIKEQYPKDDQTCIRFGFDMLDVAVHSMENRIWAEEEIKNKGVQFNTKWGKGIAVETINDEIMKLSQIMGYVIAVRKDPKTGNARIKARPVKRAKKTRSEYENVDIDLTPVYDKIMKLDPHGSWFFHVSKRMLLNGSSKNTDMKGTKLTISEIVEILQNL
ncbi:MAG: hypothetical protein ACHQT7_00825 [Candidatus Levyibacteriota bacterium]